MLHGFTGELLSRKGPVPERVQRVEGETGAAGRGVSAMLGGVWAAGGLTCTPRATGTLA